MQSSIAVLVIPGMDNTDWEMKKSHQVLPVLPISIAGIILK